MSKLFHRAENHFVVAWCADKTRIIQAHHDDNSESAVRSLGSRLALEEPNGPEDSGDTAHPIEVVFSQRFDFLYVQRLLVHHPDVGIGHIQDLTRGPLHDSREDRGLVFQQERRKGDSKNQAEILRAVTSQHSQGDVIHDLLPAASKRNCLRKLRSNILAGTYRRKRLRVAPSPTG